MDPNSEKLNVLRTFKIGSFHIGSAFADMLTSAVWNRILISDLGIVATPVALLSALRYLLAPLSIWAGNRSDTKPIFGRHRLPYIWGGRLLMALSLLLLPFSVVLLAENSSSVAGWAVAALMFFIYGIGTLLSGSPFMALIRDRTPPSKRGQALSIAQIMLLVAMAVVPGIYGVMLRSYSPEAFFRTVLIGAGLALPFWFFSVAGEDRRVLPTTEATSEGAAAEPAPSFLVLLREIWADPRARAFFLLLALGSISAFAQDALLEPFGGDVFGMDVGETTRFNAFWGVGVLISMIVTTVLTRKRAPHEQTSTARIGLMLSAVPMALLGLVAVFQLEALLIPAILLFGVGFGVYTVGAIGLLMAMTSDKHAGAYLGLWTVAQLVFRGVGMALGGIVFDLANLITRGPHLAYGSVFLLSAVGFVVCIGILARVDAPGFAAGRVSIHEPALAMADG
ncbi:BCD family MFS transporter [Candidatus Chloroploca sp. Khr17]|uniref:BCD family MFS transporter n=1 Tax=Candidatus Chloroploca sp. Khr17 TaxID=2496869 RepID=UPI00101D5605|nr:BCD family MFS transporter [Candidatus Chloroploca sp. Khr17]